MKGENSNIFANAFTGNGGNVNITTNGIYGLEFRPQLTSLSDIAASSQFGVQGNVTVNTPEIDPSRGLTSFRLILSIHRNRLARVVLREENHLIVKITLRSQVEVAYQRVLVMSYLLINL